MALIKIVLQKKGDIMREDIRMHHYHGVVQGTADPRDVSETQVFCTKGRQYISSFVSKEKKFILLHPRLFGKLGSQVIRKCEFVLLYHKGTDQWTIGTASCGSLVCKYIYSIYSLYIHIYLLFNF